MNRKFLLYFPGYFDGDELIGIYDDVMELKEAYDRVLADENQEYEFFINDPHTKLTVKEFDSDSQKFMDVDLGKLWKYTDELRSNYQKVRFILSSEWMYEFYKNNIWHIDHGIAICGNFPEDIDRHDWSHDDMEVNVYFSEKSASAILSGMGEWWGDWNECPSSEKMAEIVKIWEEKYRVILVEIAHDRLTFRCGRKLDEKEAEQLLLELNDLSSNAWDLGDCQELKKRILEEGLFSLWWD